MLELMKHLDDFTLLRYVTEDLDAGDREETGLHLRGCVDCSSLLTELRRLDASLESIGPEAFEEAEALELPPGDPFRTRPAVETPPRSVRMSPEQFIETCIPASQRGAEGREALLEAAGDARQLKDLLGSLSFAACADRYALLYALQEAGQRIAANPARMRRFAEEVLERLRLRPDGHAAAGDEGLAERAVPRLVLFGHAHMLAGQANNWSGEYEAAGAHLRIAYSSFAREGEVVSLASVELLESQRRFFLGRGEEALALARRAAVTFESLGLEEVLARARVSEGMALVCLGRTEEALNRYRSTLAIFEAHSLWSNYVATLNNAAVCLVKLGRLDEARREYARALRRLSRTEHRSLLAFIRHGLAEVLFAGQRYREAARSVLSARRLYDECGLPANGLTAWLFEIESWARSGDLVRAQETFEAFLSRLAKDESLDPAVIAQVERALSGLDPDFKNIAELRHRAEAVLPPSWRGMSA